MKNIYKYALAASSQFMAASSQPKSDCPQLLNTDFHVILEKQCRRKICCQLKEIVSLYEYNVFEVSR